jgi:acetolactate synthase-1/3 small subunit
MALPRSPVSSKKDELDVKDAGDVVDASTLPPG